MENINQYDLFVKNNKIRKSEKLKNLDIQGKVINKSDYLVICFDNNQFDDLKKLKNLLKIRERSRSVKWINFKEILNKDEKFYSKFF